LIKIRIYFSGYQSEFYEVDQDFLVSQRPDIEIIPSHDSPNNASNGFSSDYQEIRLPMSDTNFKLVIKEKDYRPKLKLLREKDTENFKNVDICEDIQNQFINKETNDPAINNELWFITQYAINNIITIKIHFIPDETSDHCYYELNKDFMKSQIASINFTPRNYVNNDSSQGFDSTDEVISFTMPNQDVELIIKEKSLFRTLIIEPDPYQNIYGTKKIQKVIYKNISYPSTTGTFTEAIINNTVKDEIVKLYIKFEDTKMKIDEAHLYGQIIPRNIDQPGEEIPSYIYNNDDKELYQLITFKMPDNDFTLYLKWTERIYIFKIDYQFSLMSLAKYTIIRDEITIENSFNSELRLYTGDKLTITLDYASSYAVNNSSSYKIGSNTELTLASNSYFDYYNRNNRITIESTIKKQDINITLKLKFKGIKILICSHSYFLDDYRPFVAEKKRLQL
jgi:hypothetical protein